MKWYYKKRKEKKIEKMKWNHTLAVAPSITWF